ncbi:MAG: TonB family protein [Verrucomicrobia bacterium]|nr:MAG: TonB family protein [Verrucomicrobiota bacterium]
MSSLVYAINIATLALWLGLTGLNGVAWLLPVWHAPATSSRYGETAAVLSVPEISLGAPAASATASEAVPEVANVLPPEALPAAPGLPELADLLPLPEVPELAAALPPRRAGKSQVSSSATAAGDTGAGAASRMAAGKMPPPIYPAEARRKGQSGSVLVEFMVGIDGRVLSAFAKESSAWPLLNNEAVTTVRRWTFPPGSVMKLQRQIDFKLK